MESRILIALLGSVAVFAAVQPGRGHVGDKMFKQAAEHFRARFHRHGGATLGALPADTSDMTKSQLNAWAQKGCKDCIGANSRQGTTYETPGVGNRAWIGALQTCVPIDAEQKYKGEGGPQIYDPALCYKAKWPGGYGPKTTTDVKAELRRIERAMKHQKEVMEMKRKAEKRAFDMKREEEANKKKEAEAGSNALDKMASDFKELDASMNTELHDLVTKFKSDRKANAEKLGNSGADRLAKAEQEQQERVSKHKREVAAYNKKMQLLTEQEMGRRDAFEEKETKWRKGQIAALKAATATGGISEAALATRENMLQSEINRRNQNEQLREDKYTRRMTNMQQRFAEQMEWERETELVKQAEQERAAEQEGADAKMSAQMKELVEAEVVDQFETQIREEEEDGAKMINEQKELDERQSELAAMQEKAAKMEMQKAAEEDQKSIEERDKEFAEKIMDEDMDNSMAGNAKTKMYALLHAKAAGGKTRPAPPKLPMDRLMVACGPAAMNSTRKMQNWVPQLQMWALQSGLAAGGTRKQLCAKILAIQNYNQKDEACGSCPKGSHKVKTVATNVQNGKPGTDGAPTQASLAGKVSANPNAVNAAAG